ncbi:hypothetical protein LIER_16292 [Lithospermum erythrorhizon]|uniref:Uncharacterized protein n=1 Tax=Lithospermum erythrorhizon TaxID=34254 RepID=A0AAV3Q8P1_LITER
MDDGEGGLSFDFEGSLDTIPTQPTASHPTTHNTPSLTPPTKLSKTTKLDHQMVVVVVGKGGVFDRLFVIIGCVLCV